MIETPITYLTSTKNAKNNNLIMPPKHAGNHLTYTSSFLRKQPLP